MKYLVTMHFNRGNADNVGALLEAGQAFFQKTQDANNLECAYATLEHPPKVISIISADSNEDALKTIAENPLAPLASVCVQPLADVGAVFEAVASRQG